VPNAAATTFLRKLSNLDYTRRRMEELFSRQDIALRDLLSVYEALFLRAVTGFEAFLEELFVAVLERRVRHPDIRLRMRANSRDALMDILLQGDKYLDWLPFNRTEERARLYIDGGKPFSKLTDGDKSTIKTIVTIRHAIAHPSKHARAEFERTVVGNLSLLRGERAPAGFLRSQVRSNPRQNRFEVYIAELARMAKTLI